MLAEIIPTERTFTIAGREWKVPLLGFLAFYAELETYIFQEMSERIGVLAKNAPEDMVKRLYQQAYDQCMKGIPTYEASIWTTSANGFARAFWIAVKQHNNVTYDQVRELLYPLPPQDISLAREAIDFAWGMITNPSDGARQTPQNETPTTNNGNQSSGKASSGGLSAKETGRLRKSHA